MNNIKNNIVLGLLTGFLFCCDPIEERESLGRQFAPDDLKFSVTQDPSYNNKVYLENQTPSSIPFWEFVIGTSTRESDTIIFPFAGDYMVKFTAFGRGGSLQDSSQITIEENDPYYFADPDWELLTNGIDGKYWKLTKVTLGPATNYKSVWADAGTWWSADAYNWSDSAYFDLNKNFNFIRFHNGQEIKSTFTFDTNEVIAGSVIPGPGKSIRINGNNQMNIKDGSNEMAESNKARYRIFRLTSDSLVVGQGSYYTATRATSTEDWSYFHWYVRIE